eukprot:116453-Pyramimonas_sp.AAC.2
MMEIQRMSLTTRVSQNHLDKVRCPHGGRQAPPPWVGLVPGDDDIRDELLAVESPRLANGYPARQAGAQ